MRASITCPVCTANLPVYEKHTADVTTGLTTEVMQELNSRVDVDKEKPEDVAHQYLQESGYID